METEKFGGNILLWRKFISPAITDMKVIHGINNYYRLLSQILLWDVTGSL